MFNIGDLLTYRHNKAVWILLGSHETVRGIKYILKVLDAKDSHYKSGELYKGIQESTLNDFTLIE